MAGIRGIDLYKKDKLGNGLLKPLRRLKGEDFVTGTGVALIKASVAQIAGTNKGELPWRPDFGWQIEQYRHKNNKSELLELMAYEAATAIQAFEPRLSNLQVSAEMVESSTTGIKNRIRLIITWDVRTSEYQNSAVLIGPVTQEAIV